MTHKRMRLFLCAAAVCVAVGMTGCWAREGELAASIQPASVPGGASAAPVPTIWNTGLYLPAGSRSVSFGGDAAWIVTQSSENERLLLTKLTFADETMTTIVLEDHVGRFSGAGIASDNAGHLWLSYGTQIVRVSELTGAIDRWALPEVSPADLGTDYLTAGNAQAAAWDSQTQSLFFIRNFDHMLYQFDPTDGAVVTVVDFGIYTSDLSAIGFGEDRSIFINGTASMTKYTPAAVRIAPDGTHVIPSVGNLCSAAARVVLLGSEGTVTVVAGESTEVIATIPPSTGGLHPMACSEQFVFDAAVADHQLIARRIAFDGKVSEVVTPLITGGRVTSYTGEVTPQAPLDPRLAALIPDRDGGVWLILEIGTQAISEGLPSYPSLVHLRFD